VLRRGASSASGEAQEAYQNEAAGLNIDLDSRVVTRRGQQINLAPLEYSLLYHLISNEGRVIPHQTLLAKVWGREYVDEVDYLKVYIRRLRTKLNDDPQNPELIHTERGVGYIFQVRARPSPESVTANNESAAE
jgi:DNA-binding response OmpR family regulator